MVEVLSKGMETSKLHSTNDARIGKIYLLVLCINNGMLNYVLRSSEFFFRKQNAETAGERRAILVTRSRCSGKNEKKSLGKVMLHIK
jgi:hypothetical protein